MVLLFFLALIAFCAGLLGTITGFGIATILMPIALFFFEARQALIFTSCIHWLISFWRIFFFKKNIQYDLFISFGIPSIIASILGAALAFYIDQKLFMHLCGVFFIAYAIFIWIRPTFRVRKSKPILMVGGALSGFSAGLFGIRGEITSFFLTLFDIKKDIYLATISAIALGVDTARLLVYFYKERIWDVKLLELIIFSVPFAFLGTYLGARVVKVIPENYFRFLIIGFLCLMGIKLLFFG